MGGRDQGLGVCSGQTTLQYVLLAGTLVCVPWLLAGKPYLIKRDMDAKRKDGFQALPTEDPTEEDPTEEDQLIMQINRSEMESEMRTHQNPVNKNKDSAAGDDDADQSPG